jgi:hypothetical protein
MKSEKKTKKYLFARALILFFIAGGFFSVVNHVWAAATLNMSPYSGTYNVGDSFSVSVTINSTTQASNAVDGVVSFPIDKLQIVSVSKENSIINLWAEEPTFSNSAGKVYMSGIILNPGFSGSAGKILKINFKVAKAGNAAVVFSSGSILANDGLGTNILTSFNSAQFTLLNQGVNKTPVQTPPKTGGVPVKIEMTPIVSSPTHPDGGKWYSNNNALFNWKLPDGVIGLRATVDHEPLSVPNVKYSPSDSIEEKNLTDGIWYLHVQFENKNGLGDTTHFRFKIDTEPPAPFEIKFPDGNTTDNSRPGVIFATSDSSSGISHYRIKIGNENFIEIGPEVNIDPYILPTQGTGTRDIEVEAYDFAQNKTIEKISFTILASPFMRMIKTVIQNVFIVVFLLLLLAGIYLLVLEIWYRLALFRSKLKNEVKEISSTLYRTERKKVDDNFFAGNYLNALSGYRKLQEQIPPSLQPELNERINLTAELFIVAENFKKAKVAASHNRWQEVRVLLEENESMMDTNFIYHQEVAKLYEEAQEHLTQVSEEKNTQLSNIEKKLLEAQNLAQVTKEKLIEEHSLLLAETRVREEREANNLGYQQKLASTLSLIEETKIKLAEEQSFLTVEKTKTKQLEEDNKKAVTLMEEKETLFKEALSRAEQTKTVKVTQDEDLIQAEKMKSEELVKEIKSFENIVKEKEASLKEAQAQAEAKIKGKEEEFKKQLENIEGKSREQEALLKKETGEAEARMRDEQTTLKKTLENAQGEIGVLKEKLNNAEHLAKEIEEKLAHDRGLLAAEKAKAQNLVTALSNLINPNP